MRLAETACPTNRYIVAGSNPAVRTIFREKLSRLEHPADNREVVSSNLTSRTRGGVGRLLRHLPSKQNKRVGFPYPAPFSP